MRTTTYADETNDQISWSSIWAGIAVALILGLLFNLLGAVIGFSVFLPQNSIVGPLGFGAILWLILTGIAALYVGGWVSGYWGNAESNKSGIIYGITVSGISSIISVIIMAVSVGSVISTSFSVLERVISASGVAINDSASLINKGITQMSPEVADSIKRATPNLQPVWDRINEKANDLLPQKNEVSSEKIKARLEQLIQAYLSASEDKGVEETKNELITVLVEETGKSREEIKEKVNDWRKTFMTAKEKAHQMAIEAGKKVSKAISYMALINLIVLLTGIVAASFGAIAGIRDKYDDSEVVKVQVK